jgi:hypothetical protein
MSVPSPASLGTSRDAPIMKLGKVVDHLLDEFLKPLSNPIAQVGKLKAYQGFRAKGSHLPAHVEGHVVDGEDQLYDLIHDEL